MNSIPNNRWARNLMEYPNVPSNYPHAVYSDSLTFYQDIADVTEYLNDIGEFSKNTNDYLKKFMENFDDNLYKTVDDVLTQWVKDGVISDIFSGNLFRINGTYATLVDLESALPKGGSGIYTVVSDNSWYYWVNNSWKRGGSFGESNPMAVLQNYENYIQNGWLETDNLDMFVGFGKTTISKGTFLNRKWLTVKGTDLVENQGVRIVVANSVRDFGFNRWYNFHMLLQNNVNSELYIQLVYRNRNDVVTYVKTLDTIYTTNVTPMDYNKKIYLPNNEFVADLKNVEILVFQKEPKLSTFYISQMNLKTDLVETLTDSVNLFKNRNVNSGIDLVEQNTIDNKNTVRIKTLSNKTSNFYLQQNVFNYNPRGGTNEVNVTLKSNINMNVKVSANFRNKGVLVKTKWIESLVLPQNQIVDYVCPFVFDSEIGDYDLIEYALSFENVDPYIVDILKFSVNRVYQSLLGNELITPENTKFVRSALLNPQKSEIQIFNYNGMRLVKFIGVDATIANQGLRWVFNPNKIINNYFNIEFTLQNLKLKNRINVIMSGFNGNGETIFTRNITSVKSENGKFVKHRNSFNLYSEYSDLVYCTLDFISENFEDINFSVSNLYLNAVSYDMFGSDTEIASLIMNEDNIINNGVMKSADMSSFLAKNTDLTFIRQKSKKWLNAQMKGALYDGMSFLVPENALKIEQGFMYKFSMLAKSQEKSDYALSLRIIGENNVMLYNHDYKFMTLNSMIETEVNCDMFIPLFENVNRYEFTFINMSKSLLSFSVTDIMIKKVNSVKQQFYSIKKSGAVSIFYENKIGNELTHVVGDTTGDWQGVLVDLPSTFNESVYNTKMNIDGIINSKVDVNVLMFLKYIDYTGAVVVNNELGALSLKANKNTKINTDFTFVSPIGNKKIKYAQILFVKRSGVLTDFSVGNIDINFSVQDDNKKNDDTITSKLIGDKLNAFNLNITANELLDREKHKTTMNYIGSDGVLKTLYVEASLQGDSSSLPFALKKSFRLRAYTDETYTEKLKFQWLASFKPTTDINLKAYWVEWTSTQDMLISDEIRKMTMINYDGLDSGQVKDLTQEQVVGSPLSLYMDNKYYGLFGMSAKKGDVVGLDKKNPLHCCLQGSVNSDATAFRANTASYVDGVDFSSELNDEVTPELKASFNDLLKLVNSGTNEEFKQRIASKINIASMANMIVMYMIFDVEDTWSKNTMYETRDGVKWSVVGYDHDLALGNYFMGDGYNKDMTSYTFEKMMTKSKLVQRMFETGMIQAEILKRYKAYTDVRTIVDILFKFENHYKSIGIENYVKNNDRWPTQPYNNINGFQDIQKNVVNRWWYVKSVMNSTTLNALKK